FLVCVALPLADFQLSTLLRLPPHPTSDADFAPTQPSSTLSSFHPARRRSADLAKTHPGHAHLSTRGSGGSYQIASVPGTKSPGYDVSTRVFVNFGLIVPVARAAEWMTYFFELVAQRIELGYWAHEPPSHRLLIRIWDFELEFYSMLALIPWSFVQEYVLDMLADVERGFTGVFHEHLVGTVGGVVGAMVSVKFGMMTGSVAGTGE
ncbi:MAG: hypothetical protein LQ346_008963, partial [Caloplaca aetnensis]